MGISAVQPTTRGSKGTKKRHIPVWITHHSTVKTRVFNYNMEVYNQDQRHFPIRGCTPSNLINITSSQLWDIPTIMNCNARSVTFKTDELSTIMSLNNIGIAIITETWLNENIPNDSIAISGYNIECKDRQDRVGGGVCVYIRSDIPYNRLANLESDEVEALWLTIKPRRLPRQHSPLSLGAIYHPPTANNATTIDLILPRRHFTTAPLLWDCSHRRF